MSDGNWKPLAYVLIVLLILGIIFNLVFSAFGINGSIPNPDSSITTSGLYLTLTTIINADLIDSFDTGMNIFGFNILMPIFNPFAFGGIDFKSFISSQITYLTYIPNIILFPFIILFVLALIWSGVKLLPFS